MRRHSADRIRTRTTDEDVKVPHLSPQTEADDGGNGGAQDQRLEGNNNSSKGSSVTADNTSSADRRRPKQRPAGSAVGPNLQQHRTPALPATCCHGDAVPYASLTPGPVRIRSCFCTAQNDIHSSCGFV